jgi:tetratricopeptide (TPR) repeat protein/serine/threonine protein kinase
MNPAEMHRIQEWITFPFPARASPSRRFAPWIDPTPGSPMTPLLPRGLELSEPTRRKVEAWLADFAASWDEGRLAVRLRDLPPVGDPLRLPALLGMVQIDLKQRWQHGHKVALESYLKNLPELGTADTVAASLVEAEYEARLALDKADWSDLARRFPRQSSEVRQRLERTLGNSAQSGPAAASSAQGNTEPAHHSAPAAQPNDQFGPYRIVKKLGEGGMGSVYLAHDTRLDRPVALKVPHFDPKDTSGTRERFYREARAAATLNHPNICAVHEVGQVGETLYLSMAFIEGKSLDKVFGPGKRPPQRQAALLVRKIALALAEAHKRNVVHRDLKPSNIMINQRSEPVIMDFGLARRVDEKDSRLTQEGALIGTPAYMPPEQVRGEIDALGFLCDVYSLGVLLYELLAGRLPFEGGTAKVLAQVLTQEARPPSSWRPDVEPALEAICLKAMAKQAKDRFESMSAFAQALTDYLKHPTQSGSQPAPAAGREDTLAAPLDVPASNEAMETLDAPAAPATFSPARDGEKTNARPARADTVKPEPERKRTHAARKEEPPDEVEMVEEKSSKRSRSGSGVRCRPRKESSTEASGAARWLLLGGGLAVFLIAGVTAAFLLRGGRRNRETAAIQQPAEQPGKNEEVKPVSSGPNDEALANYQKGLDAFNRKDYDAALPFLHDAIRLAPAYVPAHAQRGRVYAAKGDMNQAIADYTEAIKLDAGNAQVLNARAEAYLAKKDHQHALEDCNAALKLESNYAAGYNNRGRAYRELKKPEQAIADFTQALRHDPKMAIAYNNRALAFQDQKNHESAFADFAAALKLDPRLFLAYFNRARLYNQRKESQKAIADYSEALKIDPRHFDCLNERGVLYWRGGEADKAMEDYTAIISIKPDYHFAYNNRGLIYNDKKEYDKAIADFTEAIRLDGNGVQPYANRAVAELGKTDYAAAVIDCTSAIRVNPGYSLAYQYRARAYIAQRSYTAAITDLTTAITLTPKDGVNYYYRGLAWHGRRGYAQAVSDFTNATLNGSKTASVYYARGEAYREKGNYDEAIKDYTQALQLDPKMESAYLFRAVAYAAKNDLKKAIEDIDGIIAVNPESSACYSARGILYSRKGDYDKAIEDHNRAIELNKDESWSYYGRGFAYAGKKKYKSALTDYNKALKINPRFAQVYYSRGMLYKAHGYPVQAQADLQQALKLDPDVARRALK